MTDEIADASIELARRAYVYGFPLVFNLDQVVRYVTTGIGANPAAAFNTFSHARALATPADEFVTINNDTVYSMAQIDLSAGPVLLTVPEVGDRYYVLQFVSAWTENFAYVGTRATGTAPGRYLLAPPDWTGDAPDDATVITCPTITASIVGRWAVDGEADGSVDRDVRAEQPRRRAHGAGRPGRSAASTRRYPPPTMYDRTVSAWSPAPWFLVSRPLGPSDEVVRQGVIDLLDRAIGSARVTRIVAPSGYGKTSALRQWADRAEGPVAWLTLTEFDDDPVRLHRGIVSSLKRSAEAVGGEASHRLLQLIPDVNRLAASYDALISALERTAASLVLVVDDAHLGGEALRDTVAHLVGDGTSSTIHLVLAGSADVDLPSKLRIDGALADVSPAALAFTAAEVDQLTATLGITGDASLAERIIDRTGGWPAAVRAVLFDVTDSAAIRGHTGSRAIVDLVAEEVLPRLGSDLAAFVLAATTCTRLDANLARALTGRTDSAALLEACVRRGLFIDRYEDGDETVVYRWHVVLAEACQAILGERDAEELERLHRTAALALRDDYPLPAVDHALRAGDGELAVDIIATSWAGILLQAGASALERACRTLPRPWSASPEVLHARACCLDVAGDRLGAALLAERAVAVAAEIEPGRRARAALVAAEAALLLADEHPVLLAAVDDLTRLLKSATDLPPRTYGHLLFLAGWAEMRLRRSPEHAIRLLESARLEAIAVGDDVVAHRAGVNAAFALTFAGRFRDAEARLDESNAALAVRADWNAYDGGIEATARGYRFDPARVDRPLAGSMPWAGWIGTVPVTDGQVAYEWSHLVAKLHRRSPETAARWEGLAASDVEVHPLFLVVPGPVAGWERPAAAS